MHISSYFFLAAAGLLLAAKNFEPFDESPKWRHVLAWSLLLGAGVSAAVAGVTAFAC